MAVVLKDLIGLLESAAPPELKEEWDNTGLGVGDPEQQIKRVLVGMDVTEELIGEAYDRNVQLILTHHPLLFNRPGSITPSTVLGRKILKLIQNGISAYSAHTNLDKVQNGMNDRLMERLGFSAWSVLSGAEGAGIGRLAHTEPLDLQTMVRRTKEALDIKDIRYCGSLQAKVRTVAVINGAGADFILAAKQAGADCIITGDTKYHEVLDAMEEGICVIDPGHFASEWLVFCDVMAQVHGMAVQQLGDVEFLYSETAHDPFRFL